MIFTFGNYTVDVDLKKTRKYYETTIYNCDCCDACRNYDCAIMTAPTSVLDFLRSLGIDPQKPGEVFGCSQDLDENGLYWYSGWYHIVGTMISGEIESKFEDSHNSFKPDPDFDFQVWFTGDRKKMGPIEKFFRTPIIELSISTKLPWLL